MIQLKQLKPPIGPNMAMFHSIARDFYPWYDLLHGRGFQHSFHLDGTLLINVGGELKTEMEMATQGHSLSRMESCCSSRPFLRETEAKAPAHKMQIPFIPSIM